MTRVKIPPRPFLRKTLEEMAPQIRRAVSRALRDAAAGHSPALRSTEDAPGGGGVVCDRCGASLSPGQPRFGPAERHWDCRDMSPPEEPPLHVDSPGVQDRAHNAWETKVTHRIIIVWRNGEVTLTHFDEYKLAYSFWSRHRGEVVDSQVSPSDHTRDRLSMFWFERSDASRGFSLRTSFG